VAKGGQPKSATIHELPPKPLTAEEQEMLDNSLVIDMQGCSRCNGEGHPQQLFLKLINPIPNEAGDAPLYEYWSICPTTNEPILLAKTQPPAVETPKLYVPGQ